MTVRDLVAAALRQIGAIAAGEDPTPAEAADALRTLNDLLDSWAAERLFLHTIRELTHPLVSGTATYTLGPSPASPTHLSITPRPAWIEAASIIIGSGPTAIERALRLIRLQRWQQLSQKAIASTIPVELYYDGAIPDRTLSLWPVPSGDLTLKLYVPIPMTIVTTLDETLVMPPGYARALRMNLAVELAPEFGAPVHPALLESARESLGIIKRANADEPWVLEVDRALAPRDIAVYRSLVPDW